MSALCILSINNSRRGARNLARRRNLLNIISPTQQRHYTSPHISYVRYTNRKIPRQSINHYFSSASTIDDDVDSEQKGDEGGGDIDALKAAIDRLKEFEPDDPDEGGDENAAGNRGQADQTDASKVDLLNVIKSSPFETSSTDSPLDDKGNDLGSAVSAAIEHLQVAPETSSTSSPNVKKNVSDSWSAANNDEVATKPSLSDLLQTDIFTKSWSESDREGSESSGSRTGYRGNSDYMRTGNAGSGDYMSQGSRNGRGKHQRWSESDRAEGSVSHGSRTGYRGNSDYMSHSSRNSRGGQQYDPVMRSGPHTDSRPSSFVSTLNETATSWGDGLSESSYQSQTPSPAKAEYDKILVLTDELLGLLSKDDDSSTLQLMDFDKVMAQWSRFHSEVDSIKNDGSTANSFDGGYGNGDASLKQKASEQCMKLLDALEHNYDCALHHALPASLASDEDLPQTKHSKLMPNAASYNLALHALAHSEKGHHVAQKSYSILMRMLDRCQKYLDIIDSGDKEISSARLPPPPFEPTIITFNSVVHAIAKSGAKDAGHLAEEVFAKMDEWKNQCEQRQSRHGDASIDEELPATSIDFYSPNKLTKLYRGVLPNARTLACVIDVWANAKTTQQQSFAPERAEAILDLAIKRRRAYVESVTGIVRGHGDFYTENQDHDPHELTDDVNESDMDFAGVEEGVEEESLDEELVAIEHEPTSEKIENEPSLPQFIAMPALRPNTVAFNTCINAWATSAPSRGREGVFRAQQLLSRLDALSESDELDLPSGHSNEIIDEDDSPDVDSSLKPNVRTYSMVMNAWANVAKLEPGSGEIAASHCEDILNKMEEKGAVDASVRPNLVAYVTSIGAWARAANNVEHAASRAEHILNRMIDLYYNEDNAALPSLEGDVENASHDAPFNSVITAYARSSDPYAADRALAVLQRLEASHIAPTATSYNAAMDVCAKHGKPEKALEIFEKMREMSITKDSTSYDTVLNAFARDDKEGSAERAYEFLCQLEEDRSSGVSFFVPSSVSYTTVLNAFARSSGKEYGGIHIVKKAKEVYEKLIGQMSEGVIYGDADPFANSCFLNCCANVNGTRSEKKEALILAITAFEDMKRRPELLGEPNQYTFGTMMKASVRLSSDADEKNRLMESLFVQACKAGCLSGAILGQFLRHTPSHLNMKALLSLGGSKRDIPESWHCNVPRKHWPTPMGHKEGGYY
ncbi:hypothetical protein ACHAXR_013419 [Thalassiosira sp. AJA248-18]